MHDGVNEYQRASNDRLMKVRNLLQLARIDDCQVFIFAGFYIITL